VGVVLVAIDTAAGGVEGGAGRTGAGCTGVDGMGAGGTGAGACMDAGTKAFCLGSFLSLALEFRGLRPTSTGLGSGCTFYRQSQYRSLVRIKRMYLLAYGRLFSRRRWDLDDILRFSFHLDGPTGPFVEIRSRERYSLCRFRLASLPTIWGNWMR
jgi:hypothetical protein